MDLDATENKSWIAGRGAANTVSWSYDALNTRVYTENTSKFGGDHGTEFITACADYGYYGLGLSLLGFDEVGTESDNNSLRLVVGIVFMALYVLNVGLSSFFNFIIVILQSANPLRMFALANRYSTAGAGTIPAFDNTSPGTVSGSISAALYSISEQVGKIYNFISDLSMAILIPMFFALALFMWLVVNKGQNFFKIFK